ncbi:Uncharacterised protein [Vibrio cholerae]|nr:Uncharacterised protein [Vibrio cholerae]
MLAQAVINTGRVIAASNDFELSFILFTPNVETRTV